MNLSQIRQEADEHLQQNDGQFSHLVFIHTAIAAGVSLLSLLISWLSTSISPGGGLSNMDTQNMLSTVQTLLQFAISIATPMWQASLFFCAMRLIQNKECSNSHLTEGFRRWGPILSSLVLRSLIYFGIILVGYFISCFIISFMPVPDRVFVEFSSFMAAPTLPISHELLYFFGLCALVFTVTICCLLIPKLYYHRLVEYRIMDNTPCGGLQAVLHSRILMRGHRKELFFLDLSFWWFYLLEAGVTVLSISYLFIPQLNMNIPVAAFASTLIALLAQLVLYRFAKPKLAITYALFYQKVYEDSTKAPAAPQVQQFPDLPSIDGE